MRSLVSMIAIFFIHYDCWKSTTERRNAVFQSIVEVGGQTENALEHRINAGDKVSNAMMKQWHQFSIINFAFH